MRIKCHGCKDPCAKFHPYKEKIVQACPVKIKKVGWFKKLLKFLRIIK
jgi:hypothetical protein